MTSATRVAVKACRRVARICSVWRSRKPLRSWRLPRADGAQLRTATRAEKVIAENGEVAVALSDGSVLRSERLLVATGRHADVACVGLDAVGVPADAHAAPVDDGGRVTQGVWAIGDVTGHGAFTHVSMYQAGVVIRDISSRSVNDRYRPEAGAWGTLRIPPHWRNHRDPTAGDPPATAAASSVDAPRSTAFQNAAKTLPADHPRPSP
jgi:hypothetical protein